MTAYGRKNMAFLSLLCLLLFSAIPFISQAKVDIHEFDNPQQEAFSFSSLYQKFYELMRLYAISH